jgi:hypothetical protein
MRAWLEGSNGTGSGTFAQKLNAALGNIGLYTIKKMHSKKNIASTENYTVFLPTEVEVFGRQIRGDELTAFGYSIQYPLYSKSDVFRSKLWGIFPWTWWLHTPAASNTTGFCAMDATYSGRSAVKNSSDADTGISPMFCIK